MEPLQYGDYPISMKTNAGERIPAFTNHESKQVKGSFDFIGVIHYTNLNVSDNSDALKNQLRDFTADMAANICMYFVKFKDNIFNKKIKVGHIRLLWKLNSRRLFIVIMKFPTC